MRRSRRMQLGLVPGWVEHVHAKELEAIGLVLGSNPELAEFVALDLTQGVDASCGAPGMSGAEVLRVALIKQLKGYTYEELSFHLQDSSCYRAFCGYGIGDSPPRRATLQQNVARIGAQTWEDINRKLVRYAMDVNMESGVRMRADATVVDSDIAEPSDSKLLLDTVTVLTRCLKQASEAEVVFDYTSHARVAKRRAYAIRYAKRKVAMLRPYKDLLKATKRTLGYSLDAMVALEKLPSPPTSIEKLLAKLRRFIWLGHRVVDQTVRRVLHGESVPAREKIVSIFEDHTDIIAKGGRKIQYGHKITLSTGGSSLVVDCVVDDGNPPDSVLVERTLDRFTEVTGKTPVQAAFDGGYASKANLALAKEKGVEEVCFNKRRGIPVLDMVKSKKSYRTLWRFRVGIESCISMLKRCFGLGRCTWKGLDHFKQYVQSSVVAYNLLLLARHHLAG